MRKDLKVSHETWKKLMKIKLEHNLKTVDDVIKLLLEKNQNEVKTNENRRIKQNF